MLTDLKTLLTTTDRSHLTADWDGLHLYSTRTWIGRFWRVVHWIRGDAVACLNRALSHAFHELEDLEKLNTECHAPGTFGIFWKTRSIKEVVDKTYMLQKIHSLTQLTPSPKLLKATQLATHYPNLPLELIYRELFSPYPKTDESLRSCRTKLQKRTLEFFPWNEDGFFTLAPKHLLFAPLIAITRQMASDPLHTTEEYQVLLKELAGEHYTSSNASLLLRLIKFFRRQTKHVSSLPPYIQEKIKDPIWVQKCSTFATIDATKVVHDLAPNQDAYYFFEKKQNGTQSLGIIPIDMVKSFHASSGH